MSRTRDSDPQTAALVASSAVPRSQRILRALGLLFGLVLFVYTLRDLQPRDLGHILRDLGPACLLILLPQALGILFHTAAWKELLAALKARANFFALTGVYIESEALRMALPAGPAIAETYSVWQVKRRFDAPWTRSLAAVAMKKAWVLCSHGVCFLALLILGREAFHQLATSMPGGWALGWVTLGTAAALLTVGGITITLLASRRAGRVATGLAARLPFARVRVWAEEQRAKPEAVAAADIAPRSQALAGLFVLGQWVTEIGETWLVLHLLGIPVSFTEAMVVELGGSLVRSLAFVVPGGLGVQDASYVSLLSGLGVQAPAASIASFVLLKRTKDIFYVLFGLSLVALGKKRSVGWSPLSSNKNAYET